MTKLSTKEKKEFIEESCKYSKNPQIWQKFLKEAFKTAEKYQIPYCILISQALN